MKKKIIITRAQGIKEVESMNEDGNLIIKLAQFKVDNSR